MNLFERIIDMIDDALDDESEMTIFERIIGIALMLIVTAIGLVCGAILLATSPIWGVPYLLLKNKRSGEVKDE